MKPIENMIEVKLIQWPIGYLSQQSTTGYHLQNFLHELWNFTWTMKIHEFDVYSRKCIRKCCLQNVSILFRLDPLNCE